MITYEGGIKLIDFGIAKAANNPQQHRVRDVQGPARLLVTGAVPVRADRSAHRRVLALDHALRAHDRTPAITADSDQEMVEHMAEARVTPPRAIDPAYPADLEAIVMKGLARDRDQRHPTAEALRHELEVFARRAELHLSNLALSRLMSQLFTEELVPWYRARDSGRTLEEHVVGETLRSKPAIDTVPEGRPKRGRSHKRARVQWAIRIAVVLALFGATYLVARWWLAPPPITAGSRSG